MQPLAVAVYNFQRGHPGKWHQINAAAALMVVPVILLFLFVIWGFLRFFKKEYRKSTRAR